MLIFFYYIKTNAKYIIKNNLAEINFHFLPRRVQVALSSFSLKPTMLSKV